MNNSSSPSVEVKLTFLNYGLSRVWSVWIDGVQTPHWSAVSKAAALKRAGIKARE